MNNFDRSPKENANRTFYKFYYHQNNWQDDFQKQNFSNNSLL